jgi:hypothetical protein
MASTSSDKLDTTIEEALQAEPYRTLPAGFERKVCKGVAVAQVWRREQRRFRLCLATVTLALSLVVVGGLWASRFLQLRILPGSQGHADYLGAWVANQGMSPVIATLLVATLGTIAALAICLGQPHPSYAPARRSDSR